MRASVAGVALCAVSVLAGCAARAEPGGSMAPTGELALRVAGGRIIGADSIVEGWTRLRVVEDGGSHIVYAMRLSPAVDPSDLGAFLAAYDTLPDPPPAAVAIGGAEVGDSSEVVLDLAPGHYLVVCPVRGRDGHRHGAVGESRVITVVAAPSGASRAAPPVATVDLPMVDFAFTGAERWSPGRHLVRVTNGGQQDHQLRLARLVDGVTLRRWLDASESEDDVRVDSTVAGMARIGPGMSGFVPVTLSPGRYVAYCLIGDRASGKPHVMLGMLREIVVE